MSVDLIEIARKFAEKYYNCGWTTNPIQLENEMREALLAAYKQGMLRAKDIASNAFRIAYNGEDKHAKICYVQIENAIQSEAEKESGK